MTKSFTAQVRGWTDLQQRRMEAVFKQSVQDVADEATRTKPAQARGGSVVEGFVPRDTGFLAASVMLSVNGSAIVTGEAVGAARGSDRDYEAPDFVLGINELKGGDTAVIAWTAVYARAQHERGWKWVESVAMRWQSIVEANVARAQSEIQ